MRLCDSHWEAVQAALDLRGLSHLLHDDNRNSRPEVSRESFAAGFRTDNYDPLIAVNWLLQYFAWERGGAYLLGHNKTGKPFCPVCEADLQGADPEQWINAVIQAQVTYAQEEGLSIRVQ